MLAESRSLWRDSRVLWASIGLLSVLAGLAGGLLLRDVREHERLTLLGFETHRLSIELMGQTLNGSLMGATALLGRVDEEIKREARGELAPNGAHVTRLLRAVAQSGDSDGGFIVGGDGIIRSSFGLGKSSTGVNVQFRPYVKAAAEGKKAVYAAIGTTTGLRTLYYAAPAYQGEGAETPVIGTVVARGSMDSIDKLLQKRSDIALLLSPQGVVFAANRPEWIGFLAGKSTPERLKAIRETKQFGKMFDGSEPSVLPVSIRPGRVEVASGRFAVAADPLNWNDPLGDWQVVLMEDMAASVPRRDSIIVGLAVGLAVLGLLTMVLNAVRSRQTKQHTAAQLEAFGRRQQRTVELKSRLAAASIRLQQMHEVAEIAQTFLSEAHPLLNAFQGVVYVVSETDNSRLRLAASFAGSEAVKEEIALGETLLGECALADHAQIIETPPPDSGGIWSIHSGLGHVQPAAVMLGPVRVQGVLLGVVELAVLSVPDEDLRQIFDEMLEILALNLKLAARNVPSREGAA